MTILTAGARELEARKVSHAPCFRIEFVADWKQAAARFNDLCPSTPFQHPQWLEAWYGAFAGTGHVEPLIAIVSDAATGEPIALLPLIRRPQKGIRIVEFADLSLTDYNAPMLTAAAPRTARAARALWRDLTAALRRIPGGADLIGLQKMPADLDGKPNPLALLGGAGPCSLNGNVVTTGDDFDAYRYSLDRTVRKELERSWRVFMRYPAATFKIVADRNEALRILSTMEVPQGRRMQQLGLHFILNDEACAAFYRKLVGSGVDNGYVVVSALTVGEEVVATLLGIRTGSHYLMIRISNAGEKWSNFAGQIDHRTHHGGPAQAGHAREFDFSIVNYAYKRRFGVARLPLVDISAALSWRGLPYALRDRAARELRRYPRLAPYVRRALGRPPSREEN
jgi:CelD/BcsL family acetyltransferase involved in cellulose biosynthesis